MAERVLDVAAPMLGRALPESDSAHRPLASGPTASECADRTAGPAPEGVPHEIFSRLTDTYGGDALDVLRDVRDPADWAPVAPRVPLSRAEVRYAIRREMARSLADVLERRTRLALFAAEHAGAAAPAVADALTAELGWDAERRKEELAAFDRRARSRLDWRAAAADGGPREVRGA
jgi:glycerol-3-phosphate dehydrogenase